MKMEKVGLNEKLPTARIDCHTDCLEVIKNIEKTRRSIENLSHKVDYLIIMELKVYLEEIRLLQECIEKNVPKIKVISHCKDKALID